MIKRESHLNNGRHAATCRCLIVAGMIIAASVKPALATLSEDDWQSLEQWEREKQPDAVVVPVSPPVAGLLPSLDTTASLPIMRSSVVAAEHKVDFAGLPPLFERLTAVQTDEKKQAKSKTTPAKLAPVLPDPIAEVGRNNERRGTALALPGPEIAPADAAATAACTKPKAPVIDPRVASDRATLAALQNAVKSVGAEQAFDFMLPVAAQAKPSLPTVASRAIPEIRPLQLNALP